MEQWKIFFWFGVYFPISKNKTSIYNLFFFFFIRSIHLGRSPKTIRKITVCSLFHIIWFVCNLIVFLFLFYWIMGKSIWVWEYSLFCLFNTHEMGSTKLHLCACQNVSCVLYFLLFTVYLAVINQSMISYK